MKWLFAIAAFLLANTAAQAETTTFELGGRTIRIDPDRGTISIPGVYDNTGKPPKRSRNEQDSDRPRNPTPEQARTEPQAPVPPATPQPDPANNPPPPPASTANAMPEDTPAPAPAPSVLPAPQVQQEVAPRPVPPPAVATAPEPPAVAMPSAPAGQSPNSPLGVWLTEQKEGKIRIEACGANLCGYSIDAKSNQNGEKILINMKPGKDAKWSGRIFDPKSGSTYDSTIALKGPDTLRVQGCAFGGMFCGGQTWSRLN
jgi:uncharacterized protein (DUF2147 family)